VRTLSEESGNYEQLERRMITNKINILGVSETKIRGRGGTAKKKTFVMYCGMDEEDWGPNIGGVGIVVDNNTRRSLMEWEAISNRIITARFSSNVRNVTIIQCYAPTDEADSIVKEDFYDQLRTVYERSPKADIKIIIGDLNAKVGTDNSGLEKVMGQNSMGVRNDNGDKLIDFCHA
jgi:exonuclease III